MLWWYDQQGSTPMRNVATALSIVLMALTFAGCASQPTRNVGHVEPDGLGPLGEDAYLVRCDDLRANELQPNQFRVLCPYTPEDIRTLQRARGACPPKHQWVCCTAQAVAVHRAACEPNCNSRHFAALLDDVTGSCGGSHVQEGGGTLLTDLWTEAGHRGTQRKQHSP